MHLFPRSFKRNAVLFGLGICSLFIFILSTSLSQAQTTPGGSAGGSLDCTGDPNTYACLDPTFCDNYPENIRCTDVYWCESHPDDPRCITPEFCEAMPNHPKCVPDVPEDCQNYAAVVVSCEPDGDPGNDPVECRDAFGAPTDCPDDRSDLCREKPDAPECLNPTFCDLYPQHIRCTDPGYCETHPTDPKCTDVEYCRLHPQDERCVPGEPTDCRDAAGANVPCEEDDDPSNDPTTCKDDFGIAAICPDDPEMCPDGTPRDELNRCPDPGDNQFPGDDGRECYDQVPGTTAAVVGVPCGDPDDGICANPNHLNDPDCCETWDPTGQRCLDPNGDGNNEDDGNCQTNIPGIANFTALTSCDNQSSGGQCVDTINGMTYIVPCEDDQNTYEECVQKYDEKMCDGDPYNDFNDLPTDPDQRAAILKLADYCPDSMKIFQGYRNAKGMLTHEGGWEDPIIRYDVLLVVQRFEECKDLGPYNGEFPFVDVPKNHYAYDAVGWSYAEGKTVGYTENGIQKFKGNNNVMTTEALKWIMLVKATENAVDQVMDNGMLDPSVFNKVKWMKKWWWAAIEWHVAKPPMKGVYYDINPTRPALRGEIALWLANTLGL